MKTILVTGASRGIGRAISLLFASKGYNVCGLYSSGEEDAQQTLELFRQNNLSITLIKADVSDKQALMCAVKHAEEKLGSIDVLVNNAGIAQYKQIQDVSEKELLRLFSVNVFGGVYAVQSVVDGMISKGSGNIIFISSIWSKGASCESVYSATKAANEAFARSIAKELAPSGIRVNCVSAGFIDTRMNDNLSEQEKTEFIEQIPLGRAGKAEEIASAVYYLVENDYITGSIINVDGGI